MVSFRLIQLIKLKLTGFYEKFLFRSIVLLLLSWKYFFHQYKKMPPKNDPELVALRKELEELYKKLQVRMFLNSKLNMAFVGIFDSLLLFLTRYFNFKNYVFLLLRELMIVFDFFHFIKTKKNGTNQKRTYSKISVFVIIVRSIQN